MSQARQLGVLLYQYTGSGRVFSGHSNHFISATVLFLHRNTVSLETRVLGCIASKRDQGCSIVDQGFFRVEPNQYSTLESVTRGELIDLVATPVHHDCSKML